MSYVSNHVYETVLNERAVSLRNTNAIRGGSGLAKQSDMAEWKRTTSAPSSASMTSLARALSHSRLNQLDQNDLFQSQTSLSRGQGRRRRKSSGTSVESLDISPSAEARVLVINTGGTIGMMYHNNGKHLSARTIRCNG